MQTKRNKYGLLFLLMLHSVLLHAQYQFQRDIEGDLENWNAIHLPPEVLSKLQSNFADLRIYGLNKEGDTLEVPYLLRIAEQEITQSQNPLSILNESLKEGAKYYTLQLEQESAINHLDLDFSNQNYDWLIALQGSKDGSDWYSILEDYRILSIHNELSHYEFGTLKFPTSNFRYFRIKISGTNAEVAQLAMADLSLKTEAPALYVDYAIAQYQQYTDEKTGENILQLDLGQRLPLSYVQLEVKDSIDYFRPIRFEKMYDSIPTENGYKYLYSEIARSTLSSLNSEGFNLPPTFVRHLQIIIQNNDNRALALGQISLKGYQYTLLARMSGVEKAVLMYGDPEARAPQYDLKVFENTIPADANALLLSAEQKILNGEADHAPDLFNDPLWLWAIIIGLILLLGFFSFKIIRNSGSPTSHT